MVRYKLMFREKSKKRWYNFHPTISKTAKPKYSRIDSMKKARKIKRELERVFKNRYWKIKRKG